MGSTNLAFSKKFNLQVPIRLFFLGLPSFLGKEEFPYCTYFVTGRSFVHPPLMFASQSLIISLQYIKLCISLLSQRL